MADKIAQGAEAIIYAEDDAVVKDRFAKLYRHPDLDNKLRKARTRREAKILTKLSEAQIPAPQLLSVDDKSMQVRMERVPGEMIKTVIDHLEEKADAMRYLEVCHEVGSRVGALHNQGIVHQDLTTSNMILHSEKNEVFLIDFGLSFFSNKTEDYAVDLHLLRHALESRHHRIWSKCFDSVLEGYKSVNMNAEATISRLEKVEQRGRNKGKLFV